MKVPEFFLSELTDERARENFTRVRDFFRAETPLQGFRLLTATLTALGEQTIPHALGFQPQDLIVTQVTGSGNLQWNYSKFTSSILSVTVGGAVSPNAPMTIRMLIGTLNQGAT